jgi:hypothetical protein
MVNNLRIDWDGCISLKGAASDRIVRSVPGRTSYTPPRTTAVDSIPILEKGAVLTLSLIQLLSHSRLLGVKASSRFAFAFEAPLKLVW